MIPLAIRFRRHLHPLHHARRFGVARQLMNAADVPVWVRLRHIDHPVRVRLVRHATYILARTSPELAITEVVRGLLRGATVGRFVDVGANFGYYGFLAIALSPMTTVDLVEPEPENVKLIEATIARTSTFDVALHRAALSDSVGVGDFRRDRVSGATGSMEPDAHPESPLSSAARLRTSDEIRIETSTLDAIGASGGTVDLVKIDVEGHEEAVLRGARGVLAHDEPVVIVECYHRDGRLQQILEPFGYEFMDADLLRASSEDTTNVLAWTPRRRAEVMAACEAARRALGASR